MNVLTKTAMKSRVTAFLMALVLAIGLMLPAYATPSSAPESGGGNGIFDIVGDDGHINTDDPTIKDDSTTGGFATVIQRYKTIATAILGILAITMLIFMLIQITKLGASGDNEMARKKAIGGILTTGIATALLGGSAIVVGFFWNILTKTGG